MPRPRTTGRSNRMSRDLYAAMAAEMEVTRNELKRQVKEAGPPPLYPKRLDILPYDFRSEDAELVSLARSLEDAHEMSPYRIASHGLSAAGGRVRSGDAYGARGAAGAPAATVLRVLRSRVSAPQYPRELVEKRPTHLARGKAKRKGAAPGGLRRLRSGSTASVGRGGAGGGVGVPGPVTRKQSSTADDLEELLQAEKRKAAENSQSSSEEASEGDAAESSEGDFDDYRDVYNNDGGDEMEQDDTL
mmetsp:Transcript_20180/g.71372  ORF Transcript_20180/g.71372 Transcript_20180/m.71372 type:complete len:246 (-) Transcript_20180:61-798(-)|eukprot:CAMPEP_0203826320 /NCGR_PEP_ID=MMETSP0115-20131106/56385_1 /ASSEMBLY_ACC=CAM_ASM_000227 /TAXON_ID=33651 /ORGANISM="Bicosoecid sp, Strain ms1" /LENGTH=245 /DNA_ID=CAMNT_0050735367 /DNA_START=58 /DNA_END=795 /DNA_ORIENTATION=+